MYFNFLLVAALLIASSAEDVIGVNIDFEPQHQQRQYGWRRSSGNVNGNDGNYPQQQHGNDDGNEGHYSQQQQQQQQPRIVDGNEGHYPQQPQPQQPQVIDGNDGHYAQQQVHQPQVIDGNDGHYSQQQQQQQQQQSQVIINGNEGHYQQQQQQQPQVIDGNDGHYSQQQVHQPQVIINSNAGHYPQQQEQQPQVIVNGNAGHYPQQQEQGGYHNDYDRNNVVIPVPAAQGEPKYSYGFKPVIKQYEPSYDSPMHAYDTPGHVGNVIVVQAAPELIPAKGSQYEYQTSLDHSVPKQASYQEAGHAVDYAPGKPYGGNLLSKPYSTDYVSGTKTALPLKASYGSGPYIESISPAYSRGPSYDVSQLRPSYSNSGPSIIKGPMLGTTYDVDIDALLKSMPATTYGSSHGSSIHSPFAPTIGSSFYSHSGPSYSNPHFGNYLGSYSSPEASYATSMLGYPVYGELPKVGSFADYTAASDALLSTAAYGPGYGFAPSSKHSFSSKMFPNFRGAYNSVYGYAAASSRIPFVIKAPFKSVVKALTGTAA